MARFITGIAGTPDDSFYVVSCYWNGKEWREIAINDYKTTGFLSREQCLDILERNHHHIPTFDDDPERFLKKANAINETLQDNEIPVGERAHVMAALLLALARDEKIRIHKRFSDLQREINGNIKELLKDHGKEEFADAISIPKPATEKNHQKYRKSIVDTLQHLREMNIRSAIKSGDDALGKFYETFLKYANGAKEMGIVLTPRHITKFAVDVVGIGPNDKVYDPACGTGGFLVSAMDDMRRHLGADRQDDYRNFQRNGLTGVEQRDDVYGLALVNMIFRGDGKSRIYDGNCFDHQFWHRDGKLFYTLPHNKEPEGARRPFTHVLMNPPFKLKNSPESKFVIHALQQMMPGGILFAVLPAIVIGGKKKQQQDWRKEILKRHSILAVVKLDKSVFYPIAEGTYTLILRAHEPHDMRKPVFMGVLHDDEHRPRRSKMLSSYSFVDNVERMTDELKRFIAGRPVDKNIPREQVLATINPDQGCVFSPEAYLSNQFPIIHPQVINRAINLDAAEALAAIMAMPRHLQKTIHTRAFALGELIECELSAPLTNLKGYPEGTTPVVSATYYANGITKWLDIPPELRLRDCMTVSKTHNTKPCEAFWHPYEFSAIGTVYIIKPIRDFVENRFAMLYLCQAITESNAWRYDYARNVKPHELEVYLPERNGYPDIDKIASIAENQLRVKP